MTAKTPIRAVSPHVGHAVGECIYCGETSNLTLEHVIPYFLGGGTVLPQSSCISCARITARFEGIIASHMLLPMRRRFNIQSRKKSGSVDHPVTVNEGGNDEEIRVPFRRLPPFVSWITFIPPGLIRGDLASNEIFGMGIKSARISEVDADFIHGTMRVKAHPTEFMRMLAKIALGEFFSEPILSAEGWQPLLRGPVLSGHFLPYFVGGYDEARPLPRTTAPEGVENPSPLNATWIRRTEIPTDPFSEYLTTVIELFSPAESPLYQVVTARRARPGSAITSSFKQLPMPTYPQSEFRGEAINLCLRSERSS